MSDVDRLSARIEGLARLLTDEGHLTPWGLRQIERTLDHERRRDDE